MAVRTIYEVYDILHGSSSNYGIMATDTDGNQQTVINSNDSKRYILRKYSERRYQVLGGQALTATEAETDFNEDFTLWIKNRQHNIDRMYQALFDYDYSPIENVDRYEQENTRTDDDITYGKTSTDSGTDSTTYGKTLTDSGTDTTTYGKVTTDSGTDTTTYGKVEANTGTDTDTLSGTDTFTKDGDHTTTTGRAGFNAPNTFTNSEKVVENYDDYSEQTQYGKTDTFQHGKRVTNSGSDSLQHGLTETNSGSDSLSHGKVETSSGTDRTQYGKTNTEGGEDNRDIVVGRTLHVHGNIGVTTNNQLIEAELEMRMKSLAEMLLDNFINDYTYFS